MIILVVILLFGNCVVDEAYTNNFENYYITVVYLIDYNCLMYDYIDNYCSDYYFVDCYYLKKNSHYMVDLY